MRLRASIQLVLAVTLCAISFSLAAHAIGQELPPAQTPNSHEAYAEALANADKSTFKNLLARYDEQARLEPDDVTTAVERCRFLVSATPAEEESDELGIYELLAECCEDLRRRFSHAPQAWLFRVEQSYGEERTKLIREALQESAQAESTADVARLRFMLAEQLDSHGEHSRAAKEAHLAWQVDPRLDVGLILAREAQQRGDRQQAVHWLERDLEQTDPPYALLAKARLLTELKAFSAAQRALGLHEARFPGSADELLRGRILEGLGKLAEARAAYGKMQSTGFHASEARRRRFDLELARGSAPQASAAYEALRDGGYERDPLLRQRVRLLLAHPMAPWHARDLWGLLSLLGVLSGIACIPFVVLLPVHYVGLILRERGDRYQAPYGFTLWSAAKLFGLVLATQTLAGYVIAADNLESWFQHGPVWGEPTALAATDQARLLVLSMAAELVVILGYLRLPELKRAFAWKRDPEAPIFSRVFRTIGLLMLIALANAMLVKVLAIDLTKVGGAIAPVTTQTMLSALFANYGPYPVIMVAVIFAPLTEELLFRYVLTDALEGYLPQTWANRGQALAFALCHDQWPMWPTLFCIGLFAGRLRRQTDDLTSSFLLHASWNLMVFFAMLSKFA